MAYDNTNRGTLGKNKKKTEETHPDFSGQLNVEGVDYWLSAWTKTNNDTGEKFFSLSVKPKDQKQRAKNYASKKDTFFDDAGDLDNTPF